MVTDNKLLWSLKRAKYYAYAVIGRLRSFSFDRNIQENKVQILYQRITESDFELLALLDQPGALAVDAGANRGHAAISMLVQTRHLKVHSFEPNKNMEKPLAYIQKRYPQRFNYSQYGLGTSQEKLTLNIPVGGRMDTSTSASLRASEFNKDYVQNRLKQETGLAYQNIRFQTQEVDITTLDSFNLAPVLIKVDVEGFELNALKGAEHTIKTHQPVLMIELNNLEEFMPYLESLGYQAYRYHADKKIFTPYEYHPDCLNIICLHPEKLHFPEGMFSPDMFSPGQA